jgi:hypothetical protein
VEYDEYEIDGKTYLVTQDEAANAYVRLAGGKPGAWAGSVRQKTDESLYLFKPEGAEAPSGGV